MEHYNQTLFLLINAGAEPGSFALYGAIFLAKWLVFLLPILLISMWFWGLSYHRELAVKALLTILLGLTISLTLRALWPHPRPFVVGIGHTHLFHAPDASFPSNHAVFCFAAAFSLWINGIRKRVGWFLLAVALLVCWARVFLGVHFPFDMIGGLGVGWAAAMIVNRLLQLNRWGDRLVVTLENGYRRLLAKWIAKGWLAE
ncbi:MAG: phosphatase PAP2 family protein [Magnetococcales bacterium]|nr:phosphatase PAP2 family protein [Magnetococcales bacterium]